MHWFGHGRTVVETSTTARLGVADAAPEKNGKPVPVPVVLDTELNDLEAKEYDRLVKKLKLVPAPASIKQILLKALHELDIPVFLNAPVHHYLNEQFGGTTKGWFWRCLRKEDWKKTAVRSYSSSPSPEKNGQSYLPEPYSKPIPLTVLCTVERILHKMPDVGVFVSDALRESDVKDPFLAISAAGLDEMIVVEVWDEPSFRR